MMFFIGYLVGFVSMLCIGLAVYLTNVNCILYPESSQNHQKNNT